MVLGSNPSGPIPAGTTYSTTHGLWRWAEVIYAGKLLSPALRTKFLTVEKDKYALGVRIDVVPGRKVIEHGGTIAGFASALVDYPDDGTTVVVLSNLITPVTLTLAHELGAAVLAGGVVKQHDNTQT